MKKYNSEERIIDEMLHQFLNEANNLQSDAEIFKAFNKFLDKLLESSLGLMHCLWSESLLKELIEKGINDREFIESVFESDMDKRRSIFIKRFKELRKSFVKKRPSDRVQSHLIEATRCFLLGLDQAAVALCRATLDFVLRDRLKISDENVRLSKLIIDARKDGFISSKEVYKLVWDIKRIADEVMHVRPFKFNALEVINKTRIALEDILRPR